MANTILTPSMIAKEAQRLLENNIVFTKNVNTKLKKEFEGEYQKGDTVSVKRVSNYTVRKGQTAVVQDMTETSIPVTLDQQAGVDVQFSSKELTLSIDDFSKQVLQPQIATLSNTIDYDGLLLYKKVPNAVGVVGTLPSQIKTFAQAGAALDNNGCPSDDQRGVIINPLTQVELIDSQKGLFQASDEISKQYKRGRMGTAAGFEFAMSQNIPLHTVGAYAGAGAVNGAGQTGASIVTGSWTGSITGLLKAGDIITFAGVFAVNPLTKVSTGQLKQFVVTADVNSSAGAATIPISPAIVTSGANQNVTAGPANGALITVFGAANASGPVNLAYHKDAFALVTADLVLPKGMDMAARASSDSSGLSVRFVRGYDVINDKFVSRLDILYGWAAIRPELACRVHG